MSPFRIEFSSHAQQRLKERTITRQQIRQCLTDGVLMGLDIRGRKVKNVLLSKRLLEVIYLETKNGTLIVTAYWKGRYP